MENLESNKSSQEIDLQINARVEKALEQVRRDYQSAIENIENKIVAKNSFISEKAIEKSLKILYPLLGSLAGLIVIISYFGYGDIKTSVINYTNAKVDQWLAVEERDSPLKENLSTLRDRYFLDAIFIRCYKSKADDRYSDFKLTPKEISELVRIANLPDTSLKDYSDILTVYMSSYVFGAFSFPADYKGNMFMDIFTKEGFKEQSQKQREFLSIFSHDYAVFGLAKTLLDKENRYTEEAFDIVANLQSETAVAYANVHLQPGKISSLDRKMASVLAEHDFQSQTLKKYIDFLFDHRQDTEEWLFHYLFLFSKIAYLETDHVFFVNRNKKEDEIKQAFVAEMLVKLINEGYYLYVDNHFDKNVVFGKPNEATKYLTKGELDKIYKNKTLLNLLANMHAENSGWMYKLVKTLELKNGEEYIATLMLTLADGNKIKLNNNDVLDKTNVKGDVWLTISNAEPHSLLAIYRDMAGNIKKAEVSAFEGKEKINLAYQYLDKNLDFFSKDTERF